MNLCAAGTTHTAAQSLIFRNRVRMNIIWVNTQPCQACTDMGEKYAFLYHLPLATFPPQSITHVKHSMGKTNISKCLHAVYFRVNFYWD